MGELSKFERRDWLVAAALFGVSFAMRVPFRSQYAYHWDSAQFALAIEHYDLRLSLPHRPGYFLYVMLGRLVNLVVGDPHTSLVWISVVAGAALAALGFLLGAALFGRGCGWATATILGTSPLCWFHSEIALTTIVDSALVTATILICWRAMRREGGWAWVVSISVMFGVIAGVRQQTGALLLPVYMYVFSKFSGPRWAKLVVGSMVAGAVCLLWFVPMVQLSGGFGVYVHLVRTRMEMDAPLTPWGGGMATLVQNLSFIVASCWTGLFAAALLAGTETLLWVFRRKREAQSASIARYKEQFLLLVSWTLPMMTIGVAVFTLMPGYVLGYFPAIAVLAGLGLHKLANSVAEFWPMSRFLGGGRYAYAGRMAIVLGGVALVNITVFLSPYVWTRNLGAGIPVNLSNIRSHDEQLALWFMAIRAHWGPDDVLICHYRQSFFWGFRHFQYHMPDYENCLITPDRALAPPFDKKLWYAKDRRVTYGDRSVTRNKRIIVLIVPPGESVDRFAGAFDIDTAERLKAYIGAPLYTLPSDQAPPSE